MYDMTFHENRWYDSQDTDKEILGSPCKAAFLVDQSQPNLHFVSVRVQCATRIFRKIALLAAELQTKGYYLLHVNCPSFFLKFATKLTAINARVHTVRDKKLHANRLYDSRDSDHKVHTPPCELPLFVKLQPIIMGIFSLVPSDRTMCPEVDSASENEYQGFLLG
jgi:hypothetical protein